ncbi:hypothetical protein ACFQL8_10015 [Streptomyces goshikiensis]|uniref:hypothetical protein n=1 Tax=Streptomyces goshikiensis TaxID=1942 RepID=UPI001671F731|nr:hypothetical protein [Streptomyces goshikiensis]GHD63317.1 hypothetical protein GCM10010336_20180 [Streptomyces goshikiensis]
MRKLVAGQLALLEGNAFQDCMDRLGLELYPGDYQAVRAAGPKGDTKNDGYCPKARVFFAAHATRGERIDKTKNKIRGDLEGCLREHRDVKVWRFLTNDTLPGEVDQFIDNDLRPLFAGVIIEVWGLRTLVDEICKLNQEQIDRVIDLLSSTRPQPVRIVPDPDAPPSPRLMRTGRDLWPILSASVMSYSSDGPKHVTEEEEYLMAESLQTFKDWLEISAHVEEFDVQVVEAKRDITNTIAGLEAKGLVLHAATRGMLVTGGVAPPESVTMAMFFIARAKAGESPSPSGS